MRSALVDSNIFVYAYDPADRDKHERALQLIERVTLEDDLVLSAQVVNELASTLLKQRSGFGIGLEEVREATAVPTEATAFREIQESPSGEGAGRHTGRSGGRGTPGIPAPSVLRVRMGWPPRPGFF